VVNPVIELRGLTKRYARHLAMENVVFTVTEDTWKLGRPRRSRFASLSGGQWPPRFIALALDGPQVAAFDELTLGLDPLARSDVSGVPWRFDSRESMGAEASRQHAMQTGPHSTAAPAVPYRDVCR
jgi:ABC-type multidrug transport system ATPase subunit